jgi:hypothetical protein
MRLAALACWIFAAAFTVIAAREHLARGGPMRARTVASNSSNNPRDAEATLLLYAYASRTMPRGATVTAFKPRSRGEDMMVARITHGQLPYHRVVPQRDLVEPGRTPPDYVLTFGGPLDDPRYAHAYETRIGALWKRMQ